LATQGKKGKTSPRLVGVAMLGIGSAMGYLTLSELFREGSASLMPFAFFPPLVLCGLWFVVVGQPMDAATGRPVRWTQIASFAVFAAGLATAAWIGWSLGLTVK